MKNVATRLLARFSLYALVLASGSNARAWDYEGHRLVNQVALASLPTNFPSFAFTPAARERIAFLAGEPDRWRNSPDLPFRHLNAPDHYIDIDDLPLHGLDVQKLSPFRYDFTAELAQGRLAHAAKFPPVDPGKDQDHTRALVGFLPWSITEYYAKLRSGFSYLKALEEGGTAEEVRNAQENIIYVMGVMGHFVGDAAQPLHTTKHYNGWVGENPKHYPTNRTFHSWIDGGFINKAGLDRDAVLKKTRPARLPWPETAVIQTNVFPVVMSFIFDQFKLVEPLYQMEKSRKLSPSPTNPAHEGREFITGQLLKGGQMLGDLWFAAWKEAPADTFLKSQLARRALSNGQRAPAASEPKAP